MGCGSSVDNSVTMVRERSSHRDHHNKRKTKARGFGFRFGSVSEGEGERIDRGRSNRKSKKSRSGSGGRKARKKLRFGAGNVPPLGWRRIDNVNNSNNNNNKAGSGASGKQHLSVGSEASIGRSISIIVTTPRGQKNAVISPPRIALNPWTGE